MAYYDLAWYVNYGNGSTTGYYAVPQRQQNAAVVAGQICRQLTTPVVTNERVFVCIVAGTTANVTDATWVMTRGAVTTDGTVKWMECTGIAAVNGDSANTLTWSAARAITVSVSVGTVIQRNNGASYQICTTSGFTTTPEPAFSDVAGVTTTDSSVVWTSLGPVGNWTGGMAPHARLFNVFGSSWFAPGNTVYVGDNSAESSGSSQTINPASGPIARILCHNHTGNYPPQPGDITTGAQVIFTGASNFNFSIHGSVYTYGIAFRAPSGIFIGGNTSISQVQDWYSFENCLFDNTGTSSIVMGGASSSWATVIFNNCQVKFAGTSTSRIIPQFVNFTWQNTAPILATGSQMPVALFHFPNNTGRFCTFVLKNLDLSQLACPLYDNAADSCIGSLLVQDCILNPAMPVPKIINTGMTVQHVRSDSGPTAYKTARYAYEGVETTETTITRVGGAIDPAGQVQSRKIVTSAGASWLLPFKCEPYAVWNNNINANVTVTLCGLWNALNLPNNDDVWMNVEYLTYVPAVAPSGHYATLDPSTNLLTTLSGGNLAATNTGTTETEQGARVATKNAQGSGKYYFEVTYTTQTTAGGGQTIGIGLPGTSYSNMGTRGTGGVIILNSGLVYVDGTVNQACALGAAGPGIVVGIAVDIDARFIWFRYAPSGQWNGRSYADPTAGLGPVVFLPTVTTAVPYLTFGGNSGAAGNVFTANFGQAPFVGLVPTGFTPGWLEPGISAGAVGTLVSTTKANVLLTGTAVAADSSVWNNTPAATFATLDGVPANVTLTNGNLTATHNNTTSNSGARSTTSKVTGTHYFEVTVTATHGLNDAIGVVSPGTTYTQLASGLGGAVLALSNGLLWFNNANSGVSLGTVVGGSVVGVATNHDTGMAWMRKNGGSWNNNPSADPATGAGGILAGTLGVPGIPVVGFSGTGTALNDAMTVNFGATAYTMTPPVDFNNWLAGVPGRAADAPSLQVVKPTDMTMDGAPVNVAMSSGNLKATHSNTSGGGVNSTNFDGPAIGNLGVKYYFEVTLLTSVSNGNSICLMTPTDNVTDPPNAQTSSSKNKFGVLLGSSSSILYNTYQVNTGVDLGPARVNDIWGVAIDLDNALVWFRNNGGPWNNNSSANPDTGAGGMYFPVRQPVAPVGAFANGGTAGDVMLFNFGKGGFVGTPPGTVDPGGPGTGGGTLGWWSFKLAATLSNPQPGVAGYIHVRVRIGKPNATFYIDPFITLS